MPPAAQVIQYVSEPRRSNAPEPYRERGIRQLLRIQRNRDDYLEFVTMVAELVVEAAQSTPLPAEPLSVQFEEVASAFHPVAKINNVPAAINGAPPHAIELRDLVPRSDKVYFVVSAPTAEQAAEHSLGRHDRHFYGEAARDWAPYRPAANEPLADYATRIAAERSLTSQVTEVDDLEVCIDQAERDNQIVVLLVDPWSTKMEHHHDVLLHYDRRGDHPAAVMIPWSAEDIETRQQAAELNAAVRRTFPANSRRQHTTTFRPSVLTNASFGSDLQAVLAESRNRVIASGTLRRPLPGPSASRPILEGP
jgi:FxsC-like protein